MPSRVVIKTPRLRSRHARSGEEIGTDTGDTAKAGWQSAWLQRFALFGIAWGRSRPCPTVPMAALRFSDAGVAQG